MNTLNTVPNTNLVRNLRLIAAVFFLAAVARSGWAASALNIIHHFNAPVDGAAPEAGLTWGTNGYFYGTTLGGPGSGAGSVFSLTPSGTLTTIYTFGGVADGNLIYAGATLDNSTSNLVVAAAGGGTNNDGAIVWLHRDFPNTWSLFLKQSFAGTNGNDPLATMTLGDALYGTTYQGGAYSNGTVFRMTGAGVIDKLYDFTGGSDGRSPSGTLVRGSAFHTYYGTTQFGGISNNGTVFRIQQGSHPNDPWQLLTLIAFTGGDGSVPRGGLVLGTDGNLYGTTSLGGEYDEGTIFQLNPTNGVLVRMHSFNRNAAGFEGYQPRATLIQGTDGNFYGATPYGGAYDFGTIFQVSTPGVGGTSAFNTLYQFSGGTNGYLPFGALVEGRFGMLYGTTYGGGIYNNGTVFTLFVPSLTNAPSGQLTIQTNTAGLCFMSAAGSSYQLQYGDTSTGPWTSAGDPVQSNGGRLCLQDPQPTTMPQRYYRVLIIP